MGGHVVQTMRRLSDFGAGTEERKGIVTREEALAQLYALAAPPSNAAQRPDPVEAVRQSIATAASPLAETQDGPSRATSRVGEQLAVITQQLDLLRTVQQAQAEAVADNTRALAESAASRAGSAALTVAKTAASGFLGGFGLSPIVSGLLKLFGGGGGDSEAPAPVAKYAAPSALQIQAGLNGGGELTEVDYGVGGRVRALPNITVQVQAMDSRSFLDRSDEIARAVRQAMLESHAINDVVAEL